MSTHVLTWNPEMFPFEERNQDAKTVQIKGSLNGSWSCGSCKNIARESSFILVRQKVRPALIGAGTIESPPYEGAHWKNPRKRAWYVQIKFTTLFPEGKEIVKGIFPKQVQEQWFWRSQMSGIRIDEEITEAIRKFISMTELQSFPRGAFHEGTARVVKLTKYERDPVARQICLDHYGSQCAVCSFDFVKTYGKSAEGFIHVHHLKLLSTNSSGTHTNPIKDLRPVCPNCHAVIHLNPEQPLSIAKIKKMLRAAASA